MSESIKIRYIASPVPYGKYYLILFLLWPFLAFLTALINYSKKESKIVIYLFFVYYGLTFVIGSQFYVDAAGYAVNLKENALLPFSGFSKVVGSLYKSDNSVDIIEPLISFIISRFTTDHRFLFAAYAVIFGYFYLKSIDLLSNHYQKNPGWNTVIYLVFFVLIIPITYINGFRMYAAAWIFFFGAYHVILNRDPRYLLIALASSFVHWSFLSANAILIIYYLAGNRNFIYLPLAIVSFIVPQFIAPYLQLISLRLGGALQSRYESYSNESYLIDRQAYVGQSAWFLQISQNLIYYYLILAIIIVRIKYGYLMKEKPEKNLFSFLLLFISFVNFGSVIPTFGGRFQIIFCLFATLFIFLYFVKQPSNKINILTLLGLFPMLLYSAIVFRQGSESINAWILCPGLGLPWFTPGFSIADFLFY